MAKISQECHSGVEMVLLQEIYDDVNVRLSACSLKKKQKLTRKQFSLSALSNMKQKGYSHESD